MKRTTTTTTTTNAAKVTPQVLNTESGVILDASAILDAAKIAKEEAAELASIKSANSYIERMRIAVANIKSLSRVYRELREVYTFEDTELIEESDFNDFRAYMKSRHNIDADDTTTTPKRWSHWYACQFAEKVIKAAANNVDAPTYTAANKYLYADKAARRAELHAAKVARQNARTARM